MQLTKRPSCCNRGCCCGGREEGTAGQSFAFGNIINAGIMMVERKVKSQKVLILMAVTDGEGGVGTETTFFSGFNRG